MKKWFERVQYRIGYVPVAQVHRAVDEGAADLASEKAERLRVEWLAEQAEKRAAAVETGQVRVVGTLLTELAAVKQVTS